MSTASSLAVVFLARKAEGLCPPNQFLHSYLRYQAGEPHELVVVYKGFEQGDPDLVALRRSFGAVSHRSLEIDDTGVDITAYLHAASMLEHQRLCFLNTFSEIETDDWLRKLADHLRRDSTGIVGATGSYESLRSSMRLLSKVVWLCASRKIPFDRSLATYYRWLLNSQFASWLAPKRLDQWRSWVPRRRDYSRHDPDFAQHWDAVTQPAAPIAWAPDYPEFPNPHVRSNCFMVRRDDLLACGFPIITDKMESCAFESGHNSLTALIRKSGRAALIVDKEGAAFDVADWPASRTFRLGDQAGVMVTDNQVRNFKDYSRQERAIHVFMTWGEYLPPVSGLPGLGLRFPRAAGPI